MIGQGFVLNGYERKLSFGKLLRTWYNSKKSQTNIL